MKLRGLEARDVEALAMLRARLWPDAPVAELRAELDAFMDRRVVSTMPLTSIVAEDDGRLIGFVEVGLRSHADGCDPKQPVGFLEGWYVEPEHRRRGVGRALIERAEAWCREQGCLEMGSDTWLDSEDSQRAHAALGYETVDRCVHFRKAL
jgi:aminoglycoside 6'-N-acetyltransferase I